MLEAGYQDLAIQFPLFRFSILDTIVTFQDGADLVPTLFSIRSAWPTRLGSVSVVDAIR